MSIRKRIGGVLKDMKGMSYVLRDCNSRGMSMPLSRKIYLFAHGFCLEKYDLYDLGDKKNAKKYLPDKKKIRTSYINKPYDILLNDKSLFYKLMDHTGLTPKLYGQFHYGKFFLHDVEGEESQLIDLLETKGKVIVKRSNDGGGKGIYRLEYRDGQFLLNDEVLSWEALCKKTFDKKTKYLITEFIENGTYSKKIYDGCTNTIRFLSIRDPETRESRVLCAYHRFGIEGTQVTDNYQQGGIYCSIDFETGRMEAVGHKTNDGIEIISHHPNTNAPIDGVVIPNWHLAVSQVKTLLDKLDYIDYVGWDIVIQDKGIRVIEGNNNGELGGQFNYPFLTNKKMVDFLKHHNVIS